MAAKSFVIVQNSEGTATFLYEKYNTTTRAWEAIDFSGSTAIARADVAPNTGDPGDSGGNIINDAAATVEATQGHLSYTFTLADTAAVHTLRLRFHVTFPDGHLEAFPRPGWETIQIVDQILGG